MTQNSGFSTILSLGGLVELNTYTYVNNALPDPDPANTQGGFRPLITAVSTGQAITAVNTGVNRLWIWDILVYKYVSPSNNLYQPGAATYQTFYTSGSIYSAGIPVELQNLIDNPGNEPDYQYIVLVVDWRSTVSQLLKNDEDRPSYYSLIGGYGLDNRYIVEQVTIIPSVTKLVTLEYYRLNPLEPIPELKSIDWHVQSLQLFEGVAITIKLSNCVLGTLYCDDPDTRSLIVNIVISTSYYLPKYFFPEHLPELFQTWMSLYTNSNNNTNPNNLAVYPEARLIRRLAANNNVWNNALLNTDLNFDINHPMFAVDNQRAYDWHIKPQSDSSFGNLIMDSPLTIETNQRVYELYNALQAGNYLLEIPATIGTGTAENPEIPAKHRLDYYIVNGANSGKNPKLDEIHKSLNAGKWGKNPDNPDVARQDDLGWRIQRMNEVLGIRVGTDLKFDPTKEKSMVRKVIKSDQQLDPEKVGVNNFGSDGMVVKRINNRFSGNKIESDQCVIVQDVLQLIQEYHDQHNLAIGIQESSAIEIKEGKNRARFDNQLGLLVELFNLLTSANEMTRATLISSLVSQSQTNEIIAGLGLPSVTKTIPVSIDKKVTQLPYKGIAPHRSISQEVATCTANVGIVLGQIL